MLCEILRTKGAFTLSLSEREVEIFQSVNNTLNKMWHRFHIRVSIRFWIQIRTRSV